MTAYIIADVEVTDPVRYAEYTKWAGAAVRAHGARFLARGGRTECLEGRAPGRIVVLEFPSVAAARAFYDSAEYLKARETREGAAVMNMLVVEGFAEAT